MVHACIWGRLVKLVDSGAGKVGSWTAGYHNHSYTHILAGDPTRCETSTVSTHTAVAWLAHIRFIEERVVSVHAMDNEKYRNVNSGVIAQVFDQYI